MMARFRSNALLICIVVIQAAVISVNSQETNSSRPIRRFPENFTFGVATAAYQIEGSWNVSDKSEGIWDVFTKIPGAISDGTSGDDACKSYEYYKRDIEMIKYLGVHFYRFSISWPRLYPDGYTNKVSEDGMRYYDNLIDELLENGIEPVITMYHWNLPQSLQDLGGWVNPLIVDWFEDYARGLFTLFGNRVKTWVTINEPKQIGVFGYGMSRFAPGLNMPGIGDYLSAKYMLLAHARAWHVYDTEFRAIQNGICGITIATDFRYGATDSPEDMEAGYMAMDFDVGLYSHPIFTTEGNWPPRVIERVAQRSLQQGFPRSRLPVLNPEEIEYIKGTSDFYGMNLYTMQFFTPYTPGMYEVPSYSDDIGGASSYLDYTQAAAPHSTSIPRALRMALNWVKDNCNDPPIIITENGFSTFGGLDDDDRVQYYKDYLDAMLDAIEDGVNVISYTAWSLMDNFEWSSGLSVKFGIFEVDYEDDYRTRYARTSALWYKHTVANHELDYDYVQPFEAVSF